MSDTFYSIYGLVTLIVAVWFALRARKIKKSVLLWISLPLLFPVLSWIFGYYYLFNEKRAKKEASEAITINASKAQYKAYLLMIYADGEVSDTELDKMIGARKLAWCQRQAELTEVQIKILRSDSVSELRRLLDDLEDPTVSFAAVKPKLVPILKEMGAALLAMQEDDETYNPDSENGSYDPNGPKNSQHSNSIIDQTLMLVEIVLTSDGVRNENEIEMLYLMYECFGAERQNCDWAIERIYKDA
jgi:hypothetical protein